MDLNVNIDTNRSEENINVICDVENKVEINETIKKK